MWKEIFELKDKVKEAEKLVAQAQSDASKALLQAASAEAKASKINCCVIS